MIIIYGCDHYSKTNSKNKCTIILQSKEEREREKRKSNHIHKQTHKIVNVDPVKYLIDIFFFYFFVLFKTMTKITKNNMKEPTNLHENKHKHLLTHTHTLTYILL